MLTYQCKQVIVSQLLLVKWYNKEKHKQRHLTPEEHGRVQDMRCGGGEKKLLWCSRTATPGHLQQSVAACYLTKAASS